MSWPKPEITFVEPPKQPMRWAWITLFAILFITTAIILIFSWTDSYYLSSFSFWLLLVLVPSVIGGVMLSIRFYLYGLAQEQSRVA